MGAQASKAGGKAETAAEKPGEAAASPAKTNGQVGGGRREPGLDWMDVRRDGWMDGWLLWSSSMETCCGS